MAILLVTYDLREPGRNYAALHEDLRRFTYCKVLESVWLLDTRLTPEQVRDALYALIDEDDKLLVLRLTREWGSWNYGCSAWLNNPARNW